MQHDDYFLAQPEPFRSAILFLRNFFVHEINLEERIKFNTPFYYYKGKWYAFLSYDSKKGELYMSFVKGNKVSHNKLVSEGRKQMKIYRIDAFNDIDCEELTDICSLLKGVY